MSVRRIELGSKRGITQHLLNRGMPRDILRLRPFNVNHHVLTIKSDVEGLKMRRIPKSRQIAHLNDVCNKPFANPYIMVVASMPNDAKAKLTAAAIMERAVTDHIRGKQGKLTYSRSLPLWHTLTGSFADELRDSREESPSLLILSNVSTDSSNVKIEKLRDILEKFNSTPRIVVLTGSDPITFVNTRLRVAINYCLYLSTSHKVEL